MRKTWMLMAGLLSGCGGTSPELYALVMDYFTLPDSCYTSGMQPSTVVTAHPPAFMQVQVWEGPDNTAFLQIEEGATTVDMAAAPNVDLRGVFTGKKSDKGWTFTSDNVAKQSLLNNVITETTHAEVTFERGVTFKGTTSVSSSRNCVGTGCPGVNPSCSVNGVVVSGTKLAVQYERAP